MRGWCQVVASTGGDYVALEYVDHISKSSARFASKVRSSRANQRHKNCSLYELLQKLEEGVVAQLWMLSCLDRGSNDKIRGLTYLDVKRIIERKLAHQKRWLLSNTEISEAVREYKDMRGQHELDTVVLAKKITRLNDAMFRCNSDPVGSMLADKEKGEAQGLFRPA